jgi:hypothetical protein
LFRSTLLPALILLLPGAVRADPVVWGFQAPLIQPLVVQDHTGVFLFGRSDSGLTGNQTVELGTWSIAAGQGLAVVAAANANNGTFSFNVGLSATEGGQMFEQSVTVRGQVAGSFQGGAANDPVFFFDTPDPVTLGSQQFALSLASTASGSPVLGGAVFADVIEVPEPSALLLASLTLPGLALLVRQVNRPRLASCPAAP